VSVAFLFAPPDGIRDAAADFFALTGTFLMVAIICTWTAGNIG